MAAVVGLSSCVELTHILLPDEATTSHPIVPHPYAFSYSAGRAPGHIDRTHSEISDGSGVVKGAFSYVDPRNQVRTVEYVADQYGFYPQLSHEVKNTKAVEDEKNRHIALYNKIALENSQPQPNVVIVPKESVAVQYAKDKHFSLYEKIAAEHAEIGRQRAEEAALKEHQQFE